jgi:hypothetical protein
MAKYMCVGYGTSKQTGEKFYSLAPVKEGVSKDGREYGLLDFDKRVTTSEEISIGEIKEFEFVSI